ncbi:hypothetical protein [Streptosporangium sp. NPDC051022]|uniref:hypothetical protein n=1 Tax=Streptosporangium sp. NPDC051022 TaxID=3155752 RepID=UPI00342BCDA1
MSEETYTLDEARTVLADQECQHHGHDIEVTTRHGSPDPVSVFCSRCGDAWTVEAKAVVMPEPEEPRLESGVLTPEQWMQAWNEADAARQLKLAGIVISNAECVSRCFLLDHDAQAEEIERLRADNARMKVLLTRILDIPRRPAPSEQEGALGCAYTRGWESVIAAIDTALLTEVGAAHA